MNGLTRLERDVDVGDPYLLRHGRFEVHFDTTCGIVEKRDVAEGGQIERGAQRPIQARQQIQIERGGDTGGIVVSIVQYLWLFAAIHAEDHAATRPDGVPHAMQKRRRFSGMKVADGRTREERHTSRRCWQLR